MNAKDYEQDQQYNQYKDDIATSVDTFWKSLEQEPVDTDKTDKNETYLSAKMKAAREDIQGRYQSFLAYMKDTFNIQEEDILRHKIQEMVHKAHKKGYNLKASFLKNQASDRDESDDEKIGVVKY